MPTLGLWASASRLWEKFVFLGLPRVICYSSPRKLIRSPQVQRSKTELKARQDCLIKPWSFTLKSLTKMFNLLKHSSFIHRSIEHECSYHLRDVHWRDVCFHFPRDNKPCLVPKIVPLPYIIQEQWGIQLSMKIFPSAALEAKQRLHGDKCTLQLSLNKPSCLAYYDLAQAFIQIQVANPASSGCQHSRRCWAMTNQI